jgi:hypothetical protein
VIAASGMSLMHDGGSQEVAGHGESITYDSDRVDKSKAIHDEDVILAMVREIFDNCKNHGATTVHTFLLEKYAGFWHGMNETPTNVMGLISNSDATNFIGEKLGRSLLGDSWTHVGRHDAYKQQENSVMGMGKALAAMTYGPNVRTETIIVDLNKMMGTMIIWAQVRKHGDKGPVHRPHSIVFKIEKSDDNYFKAQYVDNDDPESAAQNHAFHYHLRHSLLFYTQDNSRVASSREEVKKTRKHLDHWIDYCCKFVLTTSSEMGERMHAVLSFYSSIDMMSPSTSSDPNAVPPCKLEYCDDGMDIRFYKGEAKSPSYTYLREATRNFFKVPKTPTTMPNLSSFEMCIQLSRFQGYGVEMCMVSNLMDDPPDDKLTKCDKVVNSISCAMRCTNEKSASFTIEIPGTKHDFMNGGFNERLSDELVTAVAGRPIGFTVVLSHDADGCGRVSTWGQHTMDPTGVQKCAIPKGFTLEGLQAENSKPQQWIDGRFESVVPILKGDSIEEKLQSYRELTGFDFMAFVKSALKYVRISQPVGLEHSPGTCPYGARGERLIPYRIEGKGLSMLEDFTSFYPHVHKRTIDGYESRKPLIDAARHLAVHKAVYLLSSDFKNDVDMCMRSIKYSAKWSIHQVVKMPLTSKRFNAENKRCPSTSLTMEVVRGVHHQSQPGGSGVSRRRASGGGEGSGCPRLPVSCSDASSALPPKTDVQNEEECSAKLLHNKLTLVDTNKVAGNTIMTFFDSVATGQMTSGFKFAEHSPMATAAVMLRDGKAPFVHIKKPNFNALRSSTRYIPIAATQLVEETLNRTDICNISRSDLKKMFDLLIATNYNACWVSAKDPTHRYPINCKEGGGDGGGGDGGGGDGGGGDGGGGATELRGSDSNNGIVIQDIDTDEDDGTVETSYSLSSHMAKLHRHSKISRVPVREAAKSAKRLCRIIQQHEQDEECSSSE